MAGDDAGLWCVVRQRSTVEIINAGPPVTVWWIPVSLQRGGRWYLVGNMTRRTVYGLGGGVDGFRGWTKPITILTQWLT